MDESTVLSLNLKRQIKDQSAEILVSKKGRLTEQILPCAIGVIMVHTSFNGNMDSKVFDVQGKNLLEVINELSRCFDNLKNGILANHNELNRELSMNSDHVLYSCTNPKSNESNMRDNLSTKDESMSDLENINPMLESVDIQLPDGDIKFKHPVLDQIKNIQNRLSSSTSSSSITALSSNKTRYSTTSISTQSDGSVDIVSKGKLDSSIISETSDSSMERIESTFVENSDDDDELTTKVYARWKTDHYYYSGVVKNHLFPMEVKVYFDDSRIETMKATDIFRHELLPIGTEILVDLENSGSFVKNFVVIDHVDIARFKLKSSRGYIVLCETTNTKHTVRRNCVSVHKDIVQKILPESYARISVVDSSNMSSSSISVNNILSGKRNIKARRFSQFVSPFKINVNRCNSPAISSMGQTSPYKQRSTIKHSQTRLINTNIDASYSSTQNVTLFSNWYFMITHEHTAQVDGTDQNVLTKDTIHEMIQDKGGQLIEVPDMDLIERHRRKECNIVLLVLGQSYRTMKFMTALAVGNIPIVQVDWLEECIRYSDILPYDIHLLPKGVNDNKEEILQILDKDQTCIFDNHNIWLVTDHLWSVGHKWKQVLEIAGANVFMIDTDDWSLDISADNCSFVVVERGRVTKNCMAFLRERRLDIVDVTYVIESLVQNKALQLEMYRE